MQLCRQIPPTSSLFSRFFFAGGALCQVFLFRRIKRQPILTDDATQRVTRGAWPGAHLLRFTLTLLSIGLGASLFISTLSSISTDLLNLAATYFIYGSMALLLFYFYKRHSLSLPSLHLSFSTLKKGDGLGCAIWPSYPYSP